jgi:hypothetical protein
MGALGILPNGSGITSSEGAWDVNGFYAYCNQDGNRYDVACASLELANPLTINNTSGQTVFSLGVQPGKYRIHGWAECLQGTTGVAQFIGFGGPAAASPTRIRYYFVDQGTAQSFSNYSNLGSGLGDVATPAYAAGATFWFEFFGTVHFTAAGTFGLTAASATGTETFEIVNAIMDVMPRVR